MITINKDSKPANGKSGAPQTKPTSAKTDQEILEELRQAGGGPQRRRSVGLTAFVILLAIVIAVFTAVNSRKEQQLNNTANQNNNASNEQVANENNVANEEVAVNESAETSESTTVVDSGEAVGETPNVQSTKSESGFSEAAQVGEGVTHLARRALSSYLSDQSITDITAAHKIYLEDYVAKQSNPRFLSIGETRTFSTGLLDEAVTNARALTQGDLANLQQYVALVPGL